VKDPVPILQEAGWAPGPVWTGRKSHPHQDSILDRPARSQSIELPGPHISTIHDKNKKTSCEKFFEIICGGGFTNV